MAERIFEFLESILDEFWLKIYGFWWGEYGEYYRNLRIDFWSRFLRRAFSSETLNPDLERLARFLDEPRLDLDSLGCLELNGMIEIVG